MAQKRKRKKTSLAKWIVRIFLLVLFIAAVVMVFLVWDNYFNDKKDDKAKTSEESSQVEEKTEEEDKNEEETEPVGEKEIKQYEGNNPNTSEELTGVLTYAGVSGGTLRIRVNIDQYLSGGECELNLYKDGTLAYSASAKISDSAATSTCEGFDVSTNGLSAGNYKIEVKINANNKTGTIGGEVNV